MIDILLSTYNGQKFVNAQIDSILAQTCTHWRLMVRDDGSTDQTLAIVRNYANNYPNVVLIEDTQNLGVCRSFEALLSRSDADYFMFCDQDDVWLPTKVADTLALMQEQEKALGKQTPIMVHTDVRVVDENLHTLADSFFEMKNLQPDLIHANLHYSLLYTCTTGCTLMGNAATRRIALPFPKGIVMHDNWIDRVVALRGGCCVALHKATMLYRQHGHNVCGADQKPSLRERVQRQLRDYQAYKPYVKGCCLAKYLFWKGMFYVKSRQAKHHRTLTHHKV